MSSKRDGIQARTNGDGTTSYRAQIRMRGFAPLSKVSTGRRHRDLSDPGEEFSFMMRA